MVKMSDAAVPSLLFTEHVDPSNPSAGTQRLFVDTDHILKMIDSSGTVTTFSAGFSDPMTTRGDIIVRNASNVTARLPIGSSGKVLSSDGTDVSWQTPGGGGSLTLLSSNVLGSATADITVTGISSAYKDLVLVIRARGDTAANGIGLRMGSGSIDTGSNYAYVRTYMGGAGGSDTNTGDTFANLGFIAAASSTAGSFGSVEISIRNYTSTAQWRTYSGTSWYGGNDALLFNALAGAWKNAAAALDQIRIYVGTGNLDTGSALYIYGRG
jgi:hypothetical protein